MTTPKRVSPAEAKELLEQGYLYVDVRSEPEFAEAHPLAAVNVPLLHLGAGGMSPNPDFLSVMTAAFPKDTKLVVQGLTERIDDASQQSIAHGDIGDPAGAQGLVARAQAPVLPEQHDADLLLIHVERDAKNAAGKLHHFLEADAGKSGNRGDANGNACDDA